MYRRHRPGPFRVLRIDLRHSVRLRLYHSRAFIAVSESDRITGGSPGYLSSAGAAPGTRRLVTCCPPYGVLQQRPHARWLPHGGHAMGHTAQAGRAAFGAGPVPDFGEAQRPWPRILRWKGAAFGPRAWCACPGGQHPLNRHPAARGNRALGSAGQVDGAKISPTGLSVREPIVRSQIRPQTTRSPTDATHTPTPIH